MVHRTKLPQTSTPWTNDIASDKAMINSNNANEGYKEICNAVNCSSVSTETIQVAAGKYGKISLSFCRNCVSKFREEKIHAKSHIPLYTLSQDIANYWAVNLDFISSITKYVNCYNIFESSNPLTKDLIPPQFYLYSNQFPVKIKKQLLELRNKDYALFIAVIDAAFEEFRTICRRDGKLVEVQNCNHWVPYWIVVDLVKTEELLP